MTRPRWDFSIWAGEAFAHRVSFHADEEAEAEALTGATAFLRVVIEGVGVEIACPIEDGVIEMKAAGADTAPWPRGSHPYQLWVNRPNGEGGVDPRVELIGCIDTTEAA